MTRILIVEDEPIQRMNLTFALREEGYQVKEAATSDEAIELAEQFCPHILIADWMLETDCDGMCLARRLQRHDPNLRAVISTGYPRYELEDAFDGASELVILEKPFSLATLVASIRVLARGLDDSREVEQHACAAHAP